MRHSVFFIAIIGFVFGIFARSVWLISFDVEFWIFIISLALVFYASNSRFVFSQEETKRYSIFFLICIFCLSSALGMMRYSWFVSFRGDEKLEDLIENKIVAEGIVVEEPSVKESYTQFIVLLDKVGRSGRSPELSLPKRRASDPISPSLHGLPSTNPQPFHDLSFPTKVLVRDDAYSKISYGDKVRVEGELIKPENFQSDSGKSFDYVSYLAKDGIFYQMNFAKVELVSHGHGNFFKSLMFSFKNKFLKSLDYSLPFLQSKLASGILVAGKQALPKSVQQEFQETGTIQVVVLSGYNVTIVCEAIIAMLSFLPLIFRNLTSAVFIIIFAMVAGGNATIIRAVIMAFIALLGETLRRNYDVGRALLVAGVLMLVANPMLLVFDPSFQLSFIATVGLIYGTPLVVPYLNFLTEKFNIKNIVASTIATQIFITPFILYLMGTLSLVAVPANFLVSLIVPSAMFFSFIVGTIGMISPLLGICAGFFASTFLSTILWTVHFFSSIPYASISFSGFSFLITVFIYIIYIMIFFRLKNKNKKYELV